jgi:hypothetical protein
LHPSAPDPLAMVVRIILHLILGSFCISPLSIHFLWGPQKAILSERKLKTNVFVGYLQGILAQEEKGKKKGPYGGGTRKEALK